MKIKASVLKLFIKKISLNNAINTINLDFNADGVTSSVKDITQVAMTIGKLNIEAFEDYEAIGRLYIKNTQSLMDYLTSFNDIVTLEKINEYLIKLSDEKREVHAILGSDLIVNNIMEDTKKLDGMEFDTKTTVKFGDFKHAQKDMDYAKTETITLNFKDKSLMLEVGEKGQSDYFLNKIDLPENVAESKVIMGIYFMNTVSVLCDEFSIEAKTGMPLKITEEMALMNFKCYIAPRSE